MKNLLTMHPAAFSLFSSSLIFPKLPFQFNISSVASLDHSTSDPLNQVRFTYIFFLHYIAHHLLGSNHQQSTHLHFRSCIQIPCNQIAMTNSHMQIQCIQIIDLLIRKLTIEFYSSISSI